MYNYVDMGERFQKDGYYSLGPIIDPVKSRTLLREIEATREFGPGLFQTPEQFASNPQRARTNPGPGFNVLEKMDLSFIEDHPIVRNTLNNMLGNNYTTYLKKVICGVPHHWLPEWVVGELHKNPGANLNGFIHPEYRDITFFRGTDWHADIIDHKNKPPDLITLYVYLDEVTEKDSPLVILPRSHNLGATTFPHDLTRTASGLRYSDRHGNSIEENPLDLLGPVGTIAFWHAFMLHGTRPTDSQRYRISLRYLVQLGEGTDSILQRVNASIPGNKTLEQTVSRIEPDGSPLTYENILFSASEI